MNALETQVGGTHYKKLKMQPIELIAKANLNFFQGNIVKYISRYESKNGVEDVKKAKHYAELAWELQPKNHSGWLKVVSTKIYCIENGFDERKTNIIFHAVLGNYVSVIKECNLLIEELNKEKL